MRTRLIAVAAATTVALGLGGIAAQPATATSATAPAKHSASHSYVKGKTVVTLDPGAAAALKSLKVAVVPFLAANKSRHGKTAFAFPIVGNPNDGTIEHRGGLILYTRSGKYIVLSNYTIDLTRGKVTSRVNFGSRVDLFTIGAATRDGVTLKLTGGAAAALNTTFGVTAFTKGLTFGYGNPKVFTR